MIEVNRVYRTKPNHLPQIITTLGQAGYSVDTSARVIVKESGWGGTRPVIGNYEQVNDIHGETLQITADTWRPEGKDLAKILDELKL